MSQIKTPVSPEIRALEAKATADREMTYTDPASGLQVLTSYYLKKRGYCCKTGCRHCPYGFKAQK